MRKFGKSSKLDNVLYDVERGRWWMRLDGWRKRENIF